MAEKNVIHPELLIWKKATMKDSAAMEMEKLCDLLPDFEIRDWTIPRCVVSRASFHKWLERHFNVDTQHRLRGHLMAEEESYTIHGFRCFYLGALKYYKDSLPIPSFIGFEFREEYIDEE